MSATKKMVDSFGRSFEENKERTALMEQANEEDNGALVVREKISRQDIAKMVGASREMVSRVMKDLEERGFVQTLDDGSLLIKDRLTQLS